MNREEFLNTIKSDIKKTTTNKKSSYKFIPKIKVNKKFIFGFINVILSLIVFLAFLLVVAVKSLQGVIPENKSTTSLSQLLSTFGRENKTLAYLAYFSENSNSIFSYSIIFLVSTILLTLIFNIAIKRKKKNENTNI